MKWGSRGEDLQTRAARPGWGQGAKTEDFPLQTLSGPMFGIGSAWKAPRARSSRRDGGGSRTVPGWYLPARGHRGPWHLGDVPATSGGSLAHQGGPWHLGGVPGSPGAGPYAMLMVRSHITSAAATLTGCWYPEGRTMLRAALTLPEHPG